MERRDFIKTVGIFLMGAPFINYNLNKKEQKTLENQIIESSAKITGTDLLTAPVFDSEYNHVTTKGVGNDEIIAKELFKNDLQELVNQKIIENEMRDFVLPLGIYNKSNLKIDYIQGMKDMWNNKKGIDWKGEQGDILRKKRDYFIAKMKKNREKTTLREYRSNEITKGCELIKEIFNKRKFHYSDAECKAMQEIVNNLTPNVLLAYNIQELLPPAYNKKQINPIFKTYFLNQLLKGGGKTLIEGYPARYDYLLSYGPFQMTKKAMPEAIKYNEYLSSKNKIPKTTGELKNIQDHVNSASAFAYSNWERFIRKLEKNKLLNKFNKKFQGVDKTKKQTFIAGITACMHHSPSATMKKTSHYLGKGDYNKINYGVRKISFSEDLQLQKYYDSSAESYLLLKVFHILDGKYSKK